MRNPSNKFIQKNRLIGAVKFEKYADRDKFTYNGQEAAFKGPGTWSLSNGFGRNAVIFGVDNTLKSHKGA